MGFLCYLQFQSMQQICSFQIDCFVWKKSNRGEFNSINPVLVETPGQSKQECKHIRRGGGLYVYVHGRVNRNTFGNCPWLKTELAWSPRHGASDSGCLSPQTKAGTHWQTLLDLYQYGMLVIQHISDPTASLLLSSPMIFVFGLISRGVTVAWNRRRGLSGSWSLLCFGNQWSRQLYHWFYVYTVSRGDPQSLRLSVCITVTLFVCVWVVMLKRVFVICPTQGETDFKRHKSLLNA